jgi:hypothetical protein
LFGNLNSSLVSLRRLEDTLNAQANEVGTTVTRQLQTNGDLLASNQREINKTITGTSDQLIDQLKTLARLSQKVEVIVDESAVDFKDRLKELEHISSNLVVITDETATALKGVHGITDDLHKISKDAAFKTHELLFPPKQHWAKRYILRPIQHLGGTVYLLVKVANGLN